MNEQLLRQLLLLYPLRKNLKKNRRGGGGAVAFNRRWVPVFCFTQFGGAFHGLNFSKFCGTSPLIRFFHPSNAIRYTKSTDVITEESKALITTNAPVCSTVSSARSCTMRFLGALYTPFECF